MSTRRSARLAVPVLIAALGLPGCKGVPQPPQVTTAGLRIDVESARQRRAGVVVEMRIWNDYDGRISFEHGNVRLMTGDREISAKPYRSWRRGDPSVQAKSDLDFRWVFGTDQDLAAGNYRIEIRDLMLDDVPLGDTAVFEIAL